MNYRSAQVIQVPVLVAIVLMLGYAASTVFVLIFLTWINGLNPDGALVVSDLLLYRYRFSGFNGYFYTVHYSISATVLYIVIISFISYYIFIAKSFALSPCRRLIGNRLSKARAMRLWRAAVCRARIRPGRSIIVPFSFGVMAPLVSVLTDPWILIVRIEQNVVAYYSGALNLTPIPIVGWLSYTDGFVVTVGLVVSVYIMVVHSARQRVRAMPSIRRRWCRHCGYPTHRSRKLSRDPRLAVCSECGRSLT